MGAKIVQVSADDSTYYSLPGNSGEGNNQAGSADDTIFGQTYKSSQSTLIGWDVSAQAFYKGFAGYVAKILKQGTTTSLTDEAMSQVGSSKTYRVTNAAKRILDPAYVLVIYDHSGDAGVTADVTLHVDSFDYLFGEITFNSGYTPTGAVQIHSGHYFPTVALGKANSFTLTQTAEAVENTDFATAQGNSGYRTFEPGLRTVQLELDGFYDVASGLRALLQSRANIIIEINPDGNGKSLARGIFQITTEGQSGNVGALEEEKVTAMLQVPSDAYVPFGWHHENDTTLHESIQLLLGAWLDEELLFVKYLYDGTNGFSGSSVVTEATLKGTLDGMNEYTCKFQGTDSQSVIGTG